MTLSQLKPNKLCVHSSLSLYSTTPYAHIMANTVGQASPKLEKKFLQTKPPYRPNYIPRWGGIALPALPGCPACLPSVRPRPAALRRYQSDIVQLQSIAPIIALS